MGFHGKSAVEVVKLVEKSSWIQLPSRALAMARSYGSPGLWPKKHRSLRHCDLFSFDGAQAQLKDGRKNQPKWIPSVDQRCRSDLFFRCLLRFIWLFSLWQGVMAGFHTQKIHGQARQCDTGSRCPGHRSNNSRGALNCVLGC